MKKALRGQLVQLALNHQFSSPSVQDLRAQKTPAAAVLFGLFHCYQGLQGIIGTGVMGLMFVLLYLATDSLLPGIALHFLVDFAAAFVVNEHER